MGEVVMSSEERVEEVREAKMNKDDFNSNNNLNNNNNNSNCSSMVKWERFMPSVSVRVLLVEADDSTRQIIGALLRKCSYKVASVADGLKAWEVLKARPHNIDLILTEVELPSISGYALLTLIMEHEICKNIPVIMMSNHDSVSMVYKCMLRGAADFLVKPIRTNELKNLWQHVWRRQSMGRQGLGPQHESVAQEKIEATAENNATSDHSSSSKTCLPRQEEGIKKGSDAQSSCGKLDLEAESGYVVEMEDQLLPTPMNSSVHDSKIQKHNYVNCGENLCTLKNTVEGLHTAEGNIEHIQARRLEQQYGEENVNPYVEVRGGRDVVTNSSGEAIDLISALRNHSRVNTSLTDGGNTFDPVPELNLSLQRCHSLNTPENKTSYDKQMLNHSNASAFTRYVNKPSHMSNANAATVSTPKGDKSNVGDHSSDNASASNNFNAKDISLPYERKVISLPINPPKEVENEYQTASSNKLFPVPFPARGILVDVSSTPTGYGSSNPPIVCTPSSSPSPSSTNQQPNSFHQFNVAVVSGRHHYHSMEQSSRITSNQLVTKQDSKLESLEERPQISPATDQSVSSNLCNGSSGYLTGFSSTGGCTGNVHQDVGMPSGSECGNETSPVNHALTRQRSIQREAALTKFRLKRKERCYEKKVRYESRKKLAEQRPRVKGQFVRQVPPDPPPKTDSSCNLVTN